MGSIDWLAQAKAIGCRLERSGTTLKITGPKSGVEVLKPHKPEIIVQMIDDEARVGALADYLSLLRLPGTLLRPHLPPKPPYTLHPNRPEICNPSRAAAWAAWWDAVVAQRTLGIALEIPPEDMEESDAALARPP